MSRGAYVPNDGYVCTPADEANTTTNKGGSAFRVFTTAGNVKVKTVAGNDFTITNVQQYERIDIAFAFIYDTGTTAVGIEVFK